jgi:dissimilatory sulfite reductase (desulfoviridin) alpha/beta subunit
MGIKPLDAKKLAVDKNTLQLNQLINESDEMMRLVMEAGDIVAAEQAAQTSAEAEAALIIRKKGMREFAQRVRERVEENNKQPLTNKNETDNKED